jgi:hypothetical protein
VTAILGRTAVTLGFAAALLGVVTIAAGLRKNSNDLLRAGRTYAWRLLQKERRVARLLGDDEDAT